VPGPLNYTHTFACFAGVSLGGAQLGPLQPNSSVAECASTCAANSPACSHFALTNDAGCMMRMGLLGPGNGTTAYGTDSALATSCLRASGRAQMPRPSEVHVMRHRKRVQACPRALVAGMQTATAVGQGAQQLGSRPDLVRAHALWLALSLQSDTP
jgi:hypothetical protein